MADRRVAKLSAGIAIVRCDGGEYRYLLLRAYRYWDFPKGMVEPGETPLVAARREAREEAGLAEIELRWGERYLETEPYAGGKVARYYLGLASAASVTLAVNQALGRPEHHEYRWVSYATARRLVGPRLRAVLDWAHAILGERC